MKEPNPTVISQSNESYAPLLAMMKVTFYEQNFQSSLRSKKKDRFPIAIILYPDSPIEKDVKQSLTEFQSVFLRSQNHRRVHAFSFFNQEGPEEIWLNQTLLQL